MKIESLRNKLKKLENKIDYNFKNKDFLLFSMLHSSFVNENNQLGLQSNERLEFLGDAVLELVISKYLYNKFPKENEGILSLKRAALVREGTLAKIARKCKIQDYIILGKGEQKSTGNYRDSIISDALESLIAAIYLDGGMTASSKFIRKIFSSHFDNVENIETSYNYKNQLQEYTQSHFKLTPKYKLIGQTGPEHDKKFKISVYLESSYITYGTGSSKKKAEQMASKNALNLIKKKKFKLN